MAAVIDSLRFPPAAAMANPSGTEDPLLEPGPTAALHQYLEALDALETNPSAEARDRCARALADYDRLCAASVSRF